MQSCSTIHTLAKIDAFIIDGMYRCPCMCFLVKSTNCARHQQMLAGLGNEILQRRLYLRCGITALNCLTSWRVGRHQKLQNKSCLSLSTEKFLICQLIVDPYNPVTCKKGVTKMSTAMDKEFYGMKKSSGGGTLQTVIKVQILRDLCLNSIAHEAVQRYCTNEHRQMCDMITL